MQNLALNKTSATLRNGRFRQGNGTGRAIRRGREVAGSERDTFVELMQKDHSRTFGWGLLLPFRYCGSVDITEGRELLLRPTKRLAQRANIQEPICHGAMCEKLTLTCQAETHTQCVKN